jgi:hypothetical protein
MTETQTRKSDKAIWKQGAIDQLRCILPPNATVYTLTTDASPLTTCRTITVLAVDDGKILDISGPACRACGWKWNESRGVVKRDGSAYGIVETLAMALHGKRYAFYHRAL